MALTHTGAMALTGARAPDLRLAGEAKLAANIRGELFAALRLRLARAADVPVGAGGRGVGAHQGYAGAGGQADGRAVTQTHQETWPDEAQTWPRPGKSSRQHLTNMVQTPHQHGPNTGMASHGPD